MHIHNDLTLWLIKFAVTFPFPAGFVNDVSNNWICSYSLTALMTDIAWRGVSIHSDACSPTRWASLIHDKCVTCIFRKSRAELKFTQVLYHGWKVCTNYWVFCLDVILSNCSTQNSEYRLWYAYMVLVSVGILLSSVIWQNMISELPVSWKSTY